MVTTLEQFREYIRRQLGAPIKCAEVTDDQINDAVENAIMEFTRYMYGEGLYEDFFTLGISPNVSAYNVEGIEDVVDTSISRLDGINVLFSPTNMLLYNDWVIGSGIVGQGDGSNSMILSNYQTARSYLAQVQLFFGLSFKAEYRRGANIMLITPTPTVEGTILFRVFKKEEAINLYNHILVRKLAVGLTKKIYGGMNLGKYNVQMPGGGTVNYQFIYEQGVSETEQALESIRSEGNVMPFIIG